MSAMLYHIEPCERSQTFATVKTYKNMPNIHLNNETIHDLIGDIPKGILAWGIIGIFSVVLILLTMTWFIRYPDIISEKIIISSVPPPARIYAAEGAKINHFFVKNGEHVAIGQYLAVIENAANTEKVLQLENLLKKWETNQTFDIAYFPLFSGLGELESPYFVLRESLQKWANYQAKTGTETAFLANTQAQIGQTQNLTNHIYAERALLEQELNMLKKQWETQQSLQREGVVSRKDVEQAEAVYLQKQKEITRQLSEIARNDIQIQSYTQNINDRQQNYTSEKQQLESEIVIAYKQLSSTLSAWKQKYIIASPAIGKAYLLGIWYEQQYAHSGKEIMSILPDAHHFVGKIKMATTKTGKIRINQQVQIRFDSYDYKKYGTILGQISAISPIPNEEKEPYFLIDVKLPDSLMTNYQYTITPQAEMTGEAHIITEEKRLFERFLRLLPDR